MRGTVFPVTCWRTWPFGKQTASGTLQTAHTVTTVAVVWWGSGTTVTAKTTHVFQSSRILRQACSRWERAAKSQPRFKTAPMTGYPALTHTRHHTRRVPGVPGSAKRRFFNRGHEIRKRSICRTWAKAHAGLLRPVARLLCRARLVAEGGILGAVSPVVPRGE